MKNSLGFLLASCGLFGGIGFLGAAPSAANPPALTQSKDVPPPTPYAVTRREASSRVWERTVYEPAPSGQIVPKKQSYSERATGLTYREAGKWVDAKEWIDILPNGTAQAVHGQHQAYFPGDIYQGAIEVVTPDGQHLKSRPIGLSYFDGDKSVLIAELTNSVGTVVGGNQVIYANAFTTFGVDLRYLYTKAGVEQDLILRQQPPTPESLGLNPATARLQVLTEFFSPPQPAIKSENATGKPAFALPDQSLKFGAMQMGQGRAFLMGTKASDSKVRVSKQWLALAGRQFLVEEVPVDAMLKDLAKLPPTALGSSSNNHSHFASRDLQLPPPRPTKEAHKSLLAAKAPLPRPGYVLDYVLLDASPGDLTFQGDTTYYISGPIFNFGNVTLEGGTVVKFDPDSYLCMYEGAVVCKTAPYRPAVLTSMNDDTVGEIIAGSTGEPTIGSPTFAMDSSLLGSTTGIALHDIRFCYMANGIGWSSGDYGPYYMDVWNCQFINCGIGFNVYYGINVAFHNVLFGGCTTAIGNSGYADGYNVSAEHVTADVASFGVVPDPAWMKNSIVLESSGPAATLIGDAVITTSPSLPLFQVVGGGGYYLASDSPYRHAGTTNISPALLAALGQKTTYPPIIYANLTFPAATNFSPQAQRDTGQPDLGYHYDPLDYVFGGCLANSNITFTAGTAAGWFRTTSGWYAAGDGLSLQDGVIANLNGTANAPVIWTRLNTVQEQDSSAGYGPGGMTTWGWNYTADQGATINANFVHCFMMNNDRNHFRDDDCCYDGHLFLIANNCEFYGNIVGYNVTLTFTNCLFFRSCVGLLSDVASSGLTLQNCTLYSHNSYDVWAEHWGGTWPVQIFNCTFENTDLHVGTTSLYCDYNAYRLGDQQLPFSGAHDVIVTNGYNWQSSWLGDFYLTSDSKLIDAGSTGADQIGLYHFTTQTGQITETNSIVDIGYHYVATDAFGNPLDTNGDGVPDYLEDANGNGLLDSGEIDWRAYDTSLKVLITIPHNGTTLP